MSPCGFRSNPVVPLIVTLSVLFAITGCGHSKPRPNEKANRFQAEGAAAYQQGQLDRAAGLFSLALEYQPNMAEARNGLGLVALARGDKKTAEAQFRAALSLNEELAEAHHNLGELALERGEFDEAMTRFRQALAVDPGFGAARLGAGRTLMLLGRPDEARWELVKLTEIEPQNAHAHAAYAQVLAQLGRIAAAEAAAQTALAIDPKFPGAHRARGEILKRRGEFAPAADEYRLVLQAEPGSGNDRVELVTTLVAAERLEEATGEVQTLEKLAPARAEVAFIRAFLALRQRELPLAIDSARRAIRLRKTYPQARMILAEALFTAGLDAEGRRELKSFIDEAPPSMAIERRKATEFLNR
ncbi:MAG TPA: tetratricopeptide repeat protein [Polyangia bacterium]